MTLNKKTVLILVGISVVILGVIVVGLVISLRSDTQNRQDLPQPTDEIIEQSVAPDEEARAEIEEFHRINNPEVYISNKTPFETESFTVTSRLVDDGADGRIEFDVVLKDDPAIAQQAFNLWLIEQNLTQSQIEGLIINYNTEPESF